MYRLRNRVGELSHMLTFCSTLVTDEIRNRRKGQIAQRVTKFSVVSSRKCVKRKIWKEERDLSETCSFICKFAAG